MSEKKNLFIPLVIVLLAGALIFLVFFSETEEPLEEIYYAEDGTEILWDSYYFEELPEVEDGFIPTTIWNLSDCESMDIEAKNHCFRAVAVSEGNESICEKINDIELKNLCFRNMAYYYERKDLCEKTIYGKSECLFLLGLKTHDYTYCENADWERTVCINAVQQKNEEKCYTIGMGRQECWEAVNSNDLSKCNEITSFKDLCYLNILYEIEFKETNYFVCNELSETEMQDHCFFKIATETNNVNVCEQMSEEKEECIIWVAINTNNINLCYQTGIYQQECIDDVIYINNL